MEFSAADRRQLESLGIDPQRAARQLELLRAGQAWSRLERPCTPGDGILRINDDYHATLDRYFDRAAEAGRLTRFVPASGAASRMFKPLYADEATLATCRDNAPGSEAAPDVQELCRFLEQLDDFAFTPALAETMTANGQRLSQAIRERDLAPIIQNLLEPMGLGYAELPKGLLAFHAVADGARSPFVEHQAEAALLLGPGQLATLHFTVSPQHQALFEAEAVRWQQRLQEAYGCLFAISYSIQKPSTDTLALTAADQPLRDDNGQLVLRPGGHGALIENLDDLQGDIILVRNIDNVVPDERKSANLTTTRLLAGTLLELQEEQHGLLKSLHAQGDEPTLRELALAFLRDRLQAEVADDIALAELSALLDRPLRVCGMVPVAGEPGGGPFWVRGVDGRLSRQIVEGAQIDKTDPGQADILACSTHFNPVDMACAVRDWRGELYDLGRFIDHDAVIVTAKSQAGEEIRVLELPGLWNGAMAGWHTLFVEIPAEAFNPVKTVFDLLRPAHQGLGKGA
jgi:hypothetical protein